MRTEVENTVDMPYYTIHVRIGQPHLAASRVWFPVRVDANRFVVLDQIVVDGSLPQEQDSIQKIYSKWHASATCVCSARWTSRCTNTCGNSGWTPPQSS